MSGQTVMLAHELAKFYPVGQGLLKKGHVVRALNGVSFKVEQGKTLAIVGESGCGKSTLARQLTLIEAPSHGYLEIDGIKVNPHDKKQIRALRTHVQMVFQNPYASLNPRQKIGSQLAEPLLMNTSLNSSEREDQVKSMMQKVGLRPEHYYRYPHMFSGGQRQRIAIARAMILNPKIVIADEPTSALDVSIQAQVLNLFMDLQEEFHTAYVFISHNLSVVEHVADDVMVMYLGQAVEVASKQSLFKKAIHPYTKALLSATPSLHPEDRKEKISIKGELPSPLNPPLGCSFHKRCPFAKEQCSSEEPALRGVGDHLVACHFAEQFAE
jgi:dipeptide transport system ATP-binding protein